MWTAAYHAEQPMMPRSQVIHISLLGAPANTVTALGKDYKQLFLKWYRAHKPEAIVSPTVSVMEWLTEEGYGVPRDVAVVSASLQEESRLSGLVEASRETGRAAADFLVGMLQRGEYGIPSLPQRVLMEGTWYTAKPTGKQNRAVLVK